MIFANKSVPCGSIHTENNSKTKPIKNRRRWKQDRLSLVKAGTLIRSIKESNMVAKGSNTEMPSNWRIPAINKVRSTLKWYTYGNQDMI